MCLLSFQGQIVFQCSCGDAVAFGYSGTPPTMTTCRRCGAQTVVEIHTHEVQQKHVEDKATETIDSN